MRLLNYYETLSPDVASWMFVRFDGLLVLGFYEPLLPDVMHAETGARLVGSRILGSQEVLLFDAASWTRVWLRSLILGFYEVLLLDVASKEMFALFEVSLILSSCEALLPETVHKMTCARLCALLAHVSFVVLLLGVAPEETPALLDSGLASFRSSCRAA